MERLPGIRHAGAEGAPTAEIDLPNIVLVERNSMIREGIELLLRKYGHSVVARGDDAAQGYRKVLRSRPDVVLVDAELEGRPGTELVRRLRTRAPAVKALLYTERPERALLDEAMAAGAAGLLLKAASPAELSAALERVAAGDRYVDHRIDAQLRCDGGARLSPRERQVLAMLCDGLNLDAIGARLRLSRETVKTHLKNAMMKLGCRTRTAAAAEAIRAGEIDGPHGWAGRSVLD